MDMPSATIENVTISEVLATWNRPRSDQELRDFVTTHHNCLPDDSEIE
jgi:hypothetical protein